MRTRRFGELVGINDVLVNATEFEITEAWRHVERLFGGLRDDALEDARSLRELVEQMTAALKLSDGQRGALAAHLARAKSELGGSNMLVAHFLQTMLDRQVPPIRFAAVLIGMVADLRKADARLYAVASSGNLTLEVAVILARAKLFRDGGRLRELAAALAALTTAQREARTKLEAQAQAPVDELRRGREGEREALAVEAALALARLSFSEAAAQYLAVAELTSVDNAHEAWCFVMDAGRAMFNAGRMFGDSARFRDAIHLYQKIAPRFAPREGAPVNWAITQIDLGNALLQLALSEEGDELAYIVEAAAAYEAARAALEEVPREQRLLNWASAQIKFAGALEMASGWATPSDYRREAVSAYRASIEVIPRDRAPGDWSQAHMQLAELLLKMGKEGFPGCLQEAIVSYDRVLSEVTSEKMPFHFAMVLKKRGDVLVALYDKDYERVYLEEAVAAYRAALAASRREERPLDWATIQHCLGKALLKLGEWHGRPVYLDWAVVAFRGALDEVTRERAPYEWSFIQIDLGRALAASALGEGAAVRLNEAVGAFREALKEDRVDRLSFRMADTQVMLGRALHRISTVANDTVLLQEAVAVFESGMKIHEAEKNFYWVASTKESLQRAQSDLARLLRKQQDLGVDETDGK